MRPRNLEKEAAIRQVALRIISEEGLENLSMQKLAAEANVSPRTIYLKYADKEDFLVKLFIDEVLGSFEQALLQDFDEGMGFAEGIQQIWLNAFHYLKRHRSSYALLQYGKSSPFLNKAFQERDIEQGQYFSAIHRFLKHHTKKGHIHALPFEVQRAILFAPLYDLVNEYFEHLDRPRQIITEKVLLQSCEAVVRALTLKK